MSKQIFKKTIEELVEKFDRNIDVYKKQSSSFNETQLRIEFLDPMFEALGWDMNNKAGSAEQYKEVIHEDRVYIEGKPKAPDYSFKFWGERKFFLEAKQPFINIKSDYKPALQLRRYAWSAHLPVSILSDFEELAIYDTTVEPKATDKASIARLTYYKYTDYLEKWEEIYDTFAKESIQQGSFDKFIAKEKRGSQLVDKVFLKEIENWREWLAKDIAKNNSDISVTDLNFAVQKIIDRIIFLRIAEDRGIESYKTLENLIKSKNSYSELVKHFKVSQTKYNSGLFDFEADTITQDLRVSDNLLDKILEHLYYPKSPYEFSVIGVELLGSIYEQFLGKVIRLTKGHNAKIEEKPEVKKAGGVYYTPRYIVEYIVKNTVGELLKDKTPKQAEKIKILDPACGSGSFLIGAYEYILDWYLAEYIKLSDTKKKNIEKKGVIYKQVNKESSDKQVENWNLTTKEKKRIMTNNIYGVDIDSQAVEVTKLSLALKMLENENQETINTQMKLFAERILPDLNGNIKCGNSLVGSDYWNNKDLSEVSEEGIKKVNTFDWEVEFKEIMNKGGFDAVIGNPPYVRHELIIEYKPYFEKTYSTYAGTADLYTYFIEKGTELINKHGFYSIIVANKWMRAKYGQPLREFLQQKNIQEIIDFGDLPVFQNATTYPCILTMKGGKVSKDFLATNAKTLDFESLEKYVQKNKVNVNQTKLGASGWSLISSEISEIIEKILTKNISLFEYVDKEIYVGIKTGLNEAFVLESDELADQKFVYPYLRGKDIKKYEFLNPQKWVIVIPSGYTNKHKGNLEPFELIENESPLVANHLKKYEVKAKKRTDQGNYWWELRTCSYYDSFNSNKIVFPDIAIEGQFTLDNTGTYFDMTAFIIPHEDKSLLSLLNSRIINFYMKTISSEIRGGFLRWKRQYVKHIPIPAKVKNNQILRVLATKQLTIHKQLLVVKGTQKKEMLQQQIYKLDEEINQEVYKLYGLNENEINIIKKAL